MKLKYEELLNGLCFSVDDYARWTLDEYEQYIPREVKEYVRSIKEYKDVLIISNKPTVSFWVEDGKMYIPGRALKIIQALRFVPGYGIKPSHKCYKSMDVLNTTTYFGYLRHVFLAGLDMEQFCNESLPHEVVHLCGARGWEPFFEGLTELKAREVAAKHDFPLSRCGYNKEVDIVVQIQDILGKDLMSAIAFAGNETKIRRLIESEFGIKTYEAFMEVREYMSDQSRFSNTNSSKRLSVIRKVLSYSRVKYPDIEAKLWNLESVAKQEVFRNNLVKEDEEVTYAQQLEYDIDDYWTKDSKIKVFKLPDDR